MKTNSYYYLWVSLLMATLAMLCPQKICAAGATSAEINNTIVLDGSLPLSWENDPAYPWEIVSGKLRNGNTNASPSTSKVSFTFTSNETTELSLKSTNSSYGSTSSHFHRISIDGVGIFLHSAGYEVKTTRRIAKGTHVIEIEDVKESSNSIISEIYDIKVTELPSVSQNDFNNILINNNNLNVEWINHKEYRLYNELYG